MSFKVWVIFPKLLKPCGVLFRKDFSVLRKICVEIAIKHMKCQMCKEDFDRLVDDICEKCNATRGDSSDTASEAALPNTDESYSSGEDSEASDDL